MGNGTGNGLNKTKTVIGIIASAITILAMFATVIYFITSTKTGLAQLRKEFDAHVAKEEQKFSKYMPAKELEIQFNSINQTLNDIKSGINSCQQEDKEFKEQIFKLMLEIKK